MKYSLLLFYEADKLTVKSESLPKKVGLDTPVAGLFTLNWEIALYAIIFGLALFTRFYDLGIRVMSHDESLHTLYSWNLYAGKGYQHDPLMHGPFLFHATALMYFLFGDNDFTARIVPALLGSILVILPFWFRPWLGRIGGLSAAFMILISPGILYYSRYIRHDILISVWTVFMVMALFQYMRSRKSLWLYVGAAAVALMLSTKEISYIHGFIGVTFMVLAFLWEKLNQPWRQRLNIILLGVMFILIGAAAYLTLTAGNVAVAAEGETAFDPWTYVGIMTMLIGMVLGALIIQLGADVVNKPLNLAFHSLRDRLVDLGKAVLVAIIIWVLLHTTFFSNIYGIVSGSWGEIAYWLAQQEVQRGGQPWYYYLFLVPLYEFLPVFVGIIGGLVYVIRALFRGASFPAHADPEPIQPGNPAPAANSSGDIQIYWASDGGTFAAYLIYWSLIATVVYSWAGEKMPWLTIHMTLPLIFLAAHVIQSALKKYSWSTAWHKGGVLLGGALLLTIPALSAIISSDPFRSQSLQSMNETAQFIAGIVVLLLLIWVIWHFARKLGKGTALQTAFVTALVFMSLLTIRFAWMFNYVYFDYASEPMVYAHASPDVKLALNQIDEISRRTVGDKMIRVAYDNDSTWPLEWYMREYPNRVYYGENPTREALDSPVVIVGSANETKVKPYLGDQYTRFNYRLVWWPIEDYKEQTLEKLWQNYVAGPPPPEGVEETELEREIRKDIVGTNWRKMWNIIFYRHYDDYNLNEWPFVHRFNVYIRNDVLNDVWDYQSGPVQLAAGGAGSLDPYNGKRAETEAIATWGSNGSGPGQFIAPRNLTVAPDGSIYVADSGNHRIQSFDQNGNYLLEWGSEGSGPGQFSEPWGIAAGPDGSVYVADTWNHRVQVFSPTGEFKTSFGTFVNVQHDAQESPGNFWGPRDIAIDAQGYVYVTDTGNKRVQKFTPDGQFVQAWGGGGIIPGAFEEPVGIDIDSQGNIYVADTWNRRIQKFDANFNPVLQWDVVGWESESVVNKPYLAVDDAGRVFISDPEGYRIIAYNADTGEVLATWGQFGQDLSSVSLPTGLDVDSAGDLLVADSDNNRVMKFQPPSLDAGEADQQE